MIEAKVKEKHWPGIIAAAMKHLKKAEPEVTKEPATAAAQQQYDDILVSEDSDAEAA